MNNKKALLVAAMVLGIAVVLSACGKKTATTTTNTATNTNTNTNAVVTEAPYTMVGGTKVFNLTLVNGALNYKTMTFHAGDSVEVRLTSNNQPVDFNFSPVPAASTDGVFRTNIANDDKGGTYSLGCVNTSCGIITLTVIPTANANANTAANSNQATNTNTANQITKVELQRIPAGTGFTPTGTYETTTSFKVGDQFGVSVTGDFTVGSKLTHTFTDSTGKATEALSSHPDLRGGTNGSCCFSLPTTAGSYNLELYVNGAKAQSVPITMTNK